MRRLLTPILALAIVGCGSDIAPSMTVLDTRNHDKAVYTIDVIKDQYSGSEYNAVFGAKR